LFTLGVSRREDAERKVKATEVSTPARGDDTQERQTRPAPDALFERYREIARVLVRHGLGYLADMLGLERFIQLPHDGDGGPHTQPEHLRMALEEFGATFIKLGQILSTRPDLLPPEYQSELAKRQDQAPPAPAAAIQDVLRAALGRSPDEVFQTFDAEPLAAASIGQVHGATLGDDTEVVVKSAPAWPGGAGQPGSRGLADSGGDGKPPLGTRRRL
jgi:ubiquinone biosynthesis protein